MNSLERLENLREVCDLIENFASIFKIEKITSRNIAETSFQNKRSAYYYNLCDNFLESCFEQLKLFQEYPCEFEIISKFTDIIAEVRDSSFYYHLSLEPNKSESENELSIKNKPKHPLDSLNSENIECCCDLHEQLLTLIKKEFKSHLCFELEKEFKKETNKFSNESLALATLYKHPDWTNKKIAEYIGVNRTTLYNWNSFMQAREILQQDKQDFPKGSKNAKTGEIKAWDD